uniref:CSON002734 protein n=1 Tax=Culicoides sonorensis TaxID=179676 RepID=A0A336MPG9_CULSO
MEQQTSVTTTTSTSALSIQSSQQDTIVESTCAALVSQAAAAAIGSNSNSGVSGTSVIPPVIGLSATTGVSSGGPGSVSSNISETATGGGSVLKTALKTSAPVSPATLLSNQTSNQGVDL